VCFCAPTEISVFGKPIYLTLLARRSRHFAGPRFLKRGVTAKVRRRLAVRLRPVNIIDQTPTDPTRFALSAQGFVANDVESEQLVSEAETSSFGPQSLSRFASYVQHRGSIPLYWSQDTAAAMAGIKPPIQSIHILVHLCVIRRSLLKNFELRDLVISLIARPHQFNAATRFTAQALCTLTRCFTVTASQSLCSTSLRFAANSAAALAPFPRLQRLRRCRCFLEAQQRERTPRESLLLDEYTTLLSYLNQFLPQSMKIQYIAWDMARAAKGYAGAHDGRFGSKGVVSFSESCASPQSDVGTDRSNNDDVILRLSKIAKTVLDKTGFLYSGPTRGQRVSTAAAPMPPLITPDDQRGADKSNGDDDGIFQLFDEEDDTDALTTAVGPFGGRAPTNWASSSTESTRGKSAPPSSVPKRSVDAEPVQVTATATKPSKARRPVLDRCVHGR